MSSVARARSGPEVRAIPRLPKGARIGLLGGSFNPAHAGHLHISRQLRKRLDLDQVWWLVSPQNPLKPARDMASLAKRLQGAKAVAKSDRHIVVTDIETGLGTQYTADTIEALVRRAPGVRFVWLMGADNLVQIAQWRRWQDIFKAVPVAVYDRPGYTLRASVSKAAQAFAEYRLAEHDARSLSACKAPAWVYLHGALSPVSATAIRGRDQG
jgi:nicotinate-nucleotide adenylyltransferase